MNPRLVVCSRFAMPLGRPPSKYMLNPGWVHARAYIYMNFTLPSLRNQSDTDFDIVLLAHERARETVTPYLPMFEEAGVLLVFDQMKAYLAGLPAEYDTVQLLRIDSDDMYASTAIRSAKRAWQRGSYIQFGNGYWWDIPSGRLRTWNHQSSPYFGAQQPRERVASAGRFFPKRSAKGRGGHSRFRRRYRPIRLQGRQYCIVKHGRNIVRGASYGKQQLKPAAVLPAFGTHKSLWRRRRIELPPPPQVG